MSKASYTTMAIMAIKAIKDRKGASRQAIKKHIEEDRGSAPVANALRAAMKKAVDEGLITQDGQRFKNTEAGLTFIKPKKKAAKKTASKKKSSKKKKSDGHAYKTIKGKKFDKGMLDAADAATASAHDNLISMEDAKKLLKETLDGGKYTTCEKATMTYIRKNYKFTEKADALTRKAIASFAAKKAAKKPKKAPKVDKNAAH